MGLLSIDITTSPGTIFASSAADPLTTPVIIIFFGVFKSRLLILINSSVTSANSIPIQGFGLASALRILEVNKKIKN